MMEELNLTVKNEHFVREKIEEDPFYFEKLKEGQKPEYFVLACCDSRVSPSVVTQMPLGEMFVHRNIANQIVEDDESFSASLYFVLKHLGVKKIIIKGHTGCGGVAAAWSDNDEPGLRKWIQEIQAGLPEKSERPDISLDELTAINVLAQVERLKNHPVFVKYGQDTEVIGCLFQLETGELKRLTPEEKVEAAMSID